MAHLLFILVYLTIPFKALAYPEFIGFGYTTCVTCHFNGAGNGALNDYGRGLFASEIAAKTLWNQKKSDEELVASSGFLGSTQLPSWFRPSLKYRGLQLIRNPLPASNSETKVYQMQQDLNFHFPIDEEQKYLLAFNLGLISKASLAAPNSTFGESLWMTREYYARVQALESLWLYFGFMDKAYGIRHPDHTAINRAYLGLGQNDQVHGVMVHYSKDSQEFYFQPFVGNGHLAGNRHYPGLSLQYEYEPAERWRVGFSHLQESDVANKQKSASGVQIKRGIEGGHSILIDTGFKKNTPLKGSSLTGAYFWTQATTRITRGYFIQSLIEYSKLDISQPERENLRLGLGLIAFPFQRWELRFLGLSSRTIETTSIPEDQWIWQSQLHLSL